jgi:hypothetical protein
VHKRKTDAIELKMKRDQIETDTKWEHKISTIESKIKKGTKNEILNQCSNRIVDKSTFQRSYTTSDPKYVTEKGENNSKGELTDTT